MTLRLTDWRSYSWRGLQVGATAGVIYYLWFRLQAEALPWATFADPFLALPGHWAFWVAVALLPVNQGLEALKWWWLVRRYYPTLRLGRALGAVLAGNTLGLTTPNRMGEYLGRAVVLPSGHRLEAATLTVFDRLIQLGITVAVGLCSLCWLWGGVPNGSWGMGLAGACMAVCMLCIYWRAYLLRGVHRALDAVAAWLPTDWNRRLNDLRGRAGYSLVHLSLRQWTLTLGLSLLRYAVFTAQYVLLLVACGAVSGSVLDILAGIGLVFLFKSVVPTVVLTELGVRESLALWLLGGLGLWVPGVLAATSALFVLNILLPGFAGVAVLWGRPRPAA